MLFLPKPKRFFLAAVLYVFSTLAYSQNIKLIDSLRTILPTVKDDTTKTIILFELGRENWFGRNLDEAKKYLGEAIWLGDAAPYHVHQADALNLLANVHIRLEKFDSAFFYLQQAEEQNDVNFIPFIHETYSNLYYHLGDYQSSLQHALVAANGYEKSHVREFVKQSEYAYLMAGDIFMKLDQDDRALEYYQKAYQSARENGGGQSLTSALHKMATWYFSRNNFVRAGHLYDTIIVMDKDSPNKERTMFSYEGLGKIAVKEMNFQKAIDHYRTGLQYALRKNLSNHIEDFYIQIGEAFYLDKNYDSAEYYLTLAVNRATKSRNYSNLIHAYRHLSMLHEKQNKYSNALSALHLYMSYNDSILNLEKIKAVNNLEVLHRTRQKENEILRLQKSEQEKDFAIKMSNIYLALILGVAVALTIIVFLLKRNYSQKQRLQERRMKQMEQEQQVMSLQSMVNGQEAERTRIARDLHDGLGGIFSTVKMYFSTLEHENEKLKQNEIFRKSNTLIDTASVELQRIAHNMMPEVLVKLGLINAINDLCNQVNITKSLKVSLEVHGMNKRLPDNTEIILFRIIQELVNNIIKHAQATEAIIQFTKDQDRLSVVVEDNGIGFDSRATLNGNHSGIAAIKSRVNYLNGTLTFDSQKNIGTTVMMDFVIPE